MENESHNHFHLIASDPDQWSEQAESLLYSAKVLRDHLLTLVKSDPLGYRRVETLGLRRSTSLLLGLAVENMVKAVLIAQDPAIAPRAEIDLKSWRKKGGKYGAHGTLGLASDLLLTDAERDLLDRLQEQVVWGGRYPVPRNATDLQNSKAPTNKLTLYLPDDFTTTEVLMSRLKKLLFEARRGMKDQR